MTSEVYKDFEEAVNGIFEESSALEAELGRLSEEVNGFIDLPEEGEQCSSYESP